MNPLYTLALLAYLKLELLNIRRPVFLTVTSTSWRLNEHTSHALHARAVQLIACNDAVGA